MIGREDGTLRNMTVAGPGTYIDELWAIAGGQNCFNDLPSSYGTISLESLLYRNPQVIIFFNPDSPPGVRRGSDFETWSALHNTDAVKNRDIYIIGGGYALIPGPRLTRLAIDLSNIALQAAK